MKCSEMRELDASSFGVSSRDSLVEQYIVLRNLLSALLSGFALCTMSEESLEDN